MIDFSKVSKEKVNSILQRSNITNLNSEDIVQQILNQVIYHPLMLNVSTSRTIIAEEVMRISNAQPGISIGENKEFVKITIDITGSQELLDMVLVYLPLDRYLFIEGRTLTFKKFSEHRITDNDPIKAALKQDSKAAFNQVEAVFQNINERYGHFVDNELKPYIHEAIEREIKRRIQNRKDIDDLNPFV